MAVTMMQPEAVVLGFSPPPISGMSTTGGFEGYIQMRGDGTIYDLEKEANAVVAEATAKKADGTPKYPAIGSVQNLFSTGAPQLYANLDRERCKDMGVSVSDVFTAMGATFGTTYVNDFNYMGRTFQVRMQSEAAYRMLPESLNDVFVRNDKGEMIPLTAVMTLERRTAPQVMERYNVFPAAHIMGNPADGYSSGQALDAMEQAANAVLPNDFSLGWVGSALQEKLASADTTIIFVLALVMVFLILAAQYESWSLPLAVLLGRSPRDIINRAMPRGQAIGMLPSPPVLPEGLPSELLERRPDVRAAEYMIMAYNANIGVARAQFFPSISLTGMLGTLSAAVGNLFTGPAGAWSYGATGTLPILDFGRNWYNLKDAEAQKKAAIAVYRKTVQTAFKDIRTSLTSQREADAIVRSMQIQVESLRRSVDIARLQYDNGYTDYLTVLDAERQLFAAELQLASALRDRLDAVVSVCMALGGGWDDPGKSPSFPVVNTERLLQEETAAGKTTPVAAPATQAN